MCSVLHKNLMKDRKSKLRCVVLVWEFDIVLSYFSSYYLKISIHFFWSFYNSLVLVLITKMCIGLGMRNEK